VSWFPEFHTSILFESVFDDKPFSQQNKESYTQTRHRTAEAQPTHPCTTIPPGLIFNPGLLPAAASLVSPGGGVKSGRRPPGGPGLDAGEDDATLPQPEQVVIPRAVRVVITQPGANQDQTEYLGAGPNEFIAGRKS
jgi:hypothetical protein